MCTPTHRIKLITQTQTQDTLPTHCNNPQVETRLWLKSVFVYGKTCCPDSEVSSLFPHYPSMRLIWRVGDIKVEEVKNGLEPVCTPSCVRRGWEHADPDAATGVDNENLVNYKMTNHIWESNLIQLEPVQKGGEITWEMNLNSPHFLSSIYVRDECCFAQISFLPPPSKT